MIPPTSPGADSTAAVGRVLREACGCRPEIASFKCAACRAVVELEALRAALLRSQKERDALATALREVLNAHPREMLAIARRALHPHPETPSHE